MRCWWIWWWSEVYVGLFAIKLSKSCNACVARSLSSINDPQGTFPSKLLFTSSRTFSERCASFFLAETWYQPIPLRGARYTKTCICSALTLTSRSEPQGSHRLLIQTASTVAEKLLVIKQATGTSVWRILRLYEVAELSDIENYT